MAFFKTQCPVSRETFRVAAKPMTVTFTDHTGKQQSFPLVVKEFSTGSLGWNLSGKMDVVIGGTECKTQVGINLTLVGSKELPATQSQVA